MARIREGLPVIALGAACLASGFAGRMLYLRWQDRKVRAADDAQCD
jgi:hypothetical protein